MKILKFYIPIENYAQKIHQFSLNSSRNLNFKIALDFSSPRNNFQRSNIILIKLDGLLGLKWTVFFGPSTLVFSTFDQMTVYFDQKRHNWLRPISFSTVQFYPADEKTAVQFPAAVHFKDRLLLYLK